MFRSLPIVAAFAIAATALGAAETADLRGYGKVSASFAPERAVFECESGEKADVLLDKLLADLFWDREFPVREKEIKAGRGAVTVYALEKQGAAVIARAGRNVVVVGGRDELEAEAKAAGEPLFQGEEVTSRPVKRHPWSLDFYDHRAFKAYAKSMRSKLRLGVESHWPFMKSIGGAVAFFGPIQFVQRPAPGVPDWTATDYEVHEAERQDDLVVPGPDGGGRAPSWARDLYPDDLMAPSETTLLGDWGGVGMAGSAYESWSTPMEARRRLGLGFLQQSIERYRSSPAVGGWIIYAGAPGAEYNYHGIAARTWDTSPAGQAGWRSWLRDVRHWSLADLGVRWHGAAGHYASWDEVRVPDLNGFFGALGPDCYRITEGWRWRNEHGAAGDPPPGEAPGWIPVAMPPSQQQAFLPRSGANFFDVTIDPSAWLKQQQDGSDVWLVFGLIGTANHAVRVWLNGNALAVPMDIDSRQSGFALRVTGLLKGGGNHLQVALDCATSQTCGGRLAGPVFLTSHEPMRPPYLGRGANALHADLVDWQAWAVTEYHRETYRVTRKLDTDRPLILSGGGSQLFDYAAELAADYGMGVENTGREASFRPRLSGLGLAAGFYSTGEWSATPKGESLDRGFGWILFDADSSHCLFHDIEDFQLREKEDGWFTRHRRQIGMFGKYLREQPQAALLVSAESARLTGQDPFRWDLGMGELESAHYDNVYVTQKGLENGLADRYPILIDTGSEFMSPETVAALRRYVERGGTFVALHFSGRHTALDPDSCLLAELSGYRVSARQRGGKLRFEAQLPIFKGWEGKEFDGSGVVMETVAGKEPPLALARWSDGSVAVGYRRVGKGQVITLGSAFWRDGRDVAKVWTKPHELERQFMERLFTDCGISRVTEASLPEVWTRKMVTKNGLQNWLMTLNGNPEPHDADVWMKTEGAPDEVIDLQTNARTPFVAENGGISIKGVHFDAYQAKAFAVRRGTLVSGLPVWWSEKTTYWKRTPAEADAVAMPLPEVKKAAEEGVIPFEKWRFTTDPDRSLASRGAWTAVGFDDAGWKIKEAGPWNYFDPALKDYHGTGLYRAKFNVPASWNARRIYFNLFDFDIPIVYDSGDFYINGVKAASYKAHGWSQTYNYDVTRLIHPGENVLALEAVGGPKLGGLGGSVWMESHKPLATPVDLTGHWQAVQADWLSRVDAVMPGTARGKYLTREIQIPPDWKGKSTFVEWTSREQWIGSLVVNGHPICMDEYAHPFGLFARVNVSQYLKPGELNVVEIWPYRTAPALGDADAQEVNGMQLDEIRVGRE